MEESWAVAIRVPQLEQEPDETASWAGKLDIEAQESLKKEIAVHFTTKDLSWIKELILEDKDKGDNEDPLAPVGNEDPTLSLNENIVNDDIIISSLQAREDEINNPHSQ